MKLKELDLAVLERDLPRYGLRKRDVGTVVGRYSDGALEIEFVAPSGETRAVVTLTPRDVRSVRSDDVLAIRVKHRRNTRNSSGRTTKAPKNGTRSARSERSKRGPRGLARAQARRAG
jgi:hypothetical protein